MKSGSFKRNSAAIPLRLRTTALPDGHHFLAVRSYAGAGAGVWPYDIGSAESRQSVSRSRHLPLNRI